MKIASILLVLIGGTIAILGVWGEYRTALWYVAVPNDFRYNEPLMAAWWWTGAGLFLFGTGCFVLYIKQREPLSWLLLATGSGGGVVCPLLIALPYNLMGSIMILGNDSRSWEHARDNMARVLIDSEGLGVLLGVLFGVWAHRNAERNRRAASAPESAG